MQFTFAKLNSLQIKPIIIIVNQTKVNHVNNKIISLYYNFIYYK